jgi:O-antigen ligase
MHSASNGRTLAQVIADIKEEIKEFAQTRFLLFRAECRQKLSLLKIAGALAGIAVVLLATAYLLLTVGFVALIAAVLANNPYRWVVGFFGIAMLWSIVGGIAAYFAKREFALKGIVPGRTLAVLKGDKIWLQSEAKGHL